MTAMLSMLAVIALGQAKPAPAAPPMTLPQALALADASHVDVQLASLSLQQAQQDEKGSYAGILPRVDLAASLSTSYSNSQFVFTDTGVQVGSGFSPAQWFAQIAATQNLFDGGKWWLAIARGHTDREAAEAQLAEARLAAHGAVAHLFFELVRAQRALEILQVNVQRSQEQVDRAKALYEAGRGPKSDVFAAQVNLANDQIAVVRQQSALDQARDSLNITLGRAARQPVAPQPGDLAATPNPIDASQADLEALHARPGLRALRKQVQSAEQGQGIARGDYYPSLNAQLSLAGSPGSLSLGSGGLGSSTVANSPPVDLTAQGSLNLRWNLFAGRTTDVAVQKAELAASTARVQLLKSEREVEAQTEKAVRTLAEDLQALAIAKLAQSAAGQGLALAEERFRAGAASNLEVRDAQLKLTQAELTLVSTQIDLHLADIDVRAATGAL